MEMRINQKSSVFNRLCAGLYILFTGPLAEELLSVFLTVFVCSLPSNITSIIASTTHLQIQSRCFDINEC